MYRDVRSELHNDYNPKDVNCAVRGNRGHKQGSKFADLLNQDLSVSPEPHERIPHDVWIMNFAFVPPPEKMDFVDLFQ